MIHYSFLLFSSFPRTDIINVNTLYIPLQTMMQLTYILGQYSIYLIHYIPFTLSQTSLQSLLLFPSTSMKYKALCIFLYKYPYTPSTHHIPQHSPYTHYFCRVAFRTTPNDDAGAPHILEHTALCGSQKYPVRDPLYSLQPLKSLHTHTPYTPPTHHIPQNPLLLQSGIPYHPK